MLRRLLRLQRLPHRARGSSDRGLAPIRMERKSNPVRSLSQRANHFRISPMQLPLPALLRLLQSRVPQPLPFLFRSEHRLEFAALAQQVLRPLGVGAAPVPIPIGSSDINPPPTHRHSRFLHAENLCGTERSRVILDSLFVFQKRESRIGLRSELFSPASLFFPTWTQLRD